jgi:hypothetical protein
MARTRQLAVPPAKIINWQLPSGLSRIERSFLDMINFCPPSTPITARKALKNVLQSRRA